MTKFVPYEKLSKKQKKEIDSRARATWGDINPVTRKPEKENGKKFEMLAVDLIKPMGSVLPFEVVREKEFAPIKNKTGVDSVESARELLKLNGVEL